MTKVFLANDKGILSDPFFQEFNLLYKDQFSNFSPFGKSTKLPYPINAWFNDEYYVFEIPVLKGDPSDIVISRAGDRLSIKYTRPNKEDKEKVTYVQRAIVERDFNLEWKIPSAFDGDGISSTYEGGLLTIYIPFKPKEEPKKIQILDIDGNRKKVTDGTAL